MENILIVDDDVISRTMLCEILRGGYGIHEAESGVQALEMAQDRGNRISVILLDIIMPGLDGFKVLKSLKENPLTSSIPVIIISRLDSETSEIIGLQSGAIDYITKPFIPRIVQYRVENQIELKKHRDQLQVLVDEKASRLLRMHETIFDAVTSLIEYRHLESGCHVKRIRMYCQILLENLITNPRFVGQIDRKAAEIIVRASALHDIGKVAIPDNILLKPGPLTQDEFAVMKTHTTVGSDFIDSLPGIEDDSYLACAKEICRSHHERWDGMGYPDGLRAEAIPLSARVVAIADVYDALVSRRVYKPPFGHAESAEILRLEAGRQFDPALIGVFMQVQEHFHAAAQECKDE